MNEEQTKHDKITPALKEAGWDCLPFKLALEQQVAPGRIEHDGRSHKPERVDVLVFDDVLKGVRGAIWQSQEVKRIREMHQGLLNVDFVACEENVRRSGLAAMFHHYVEWAGGAAGLLHASLDSTMSKDEIVGMAEALRNRIVNEPNLRNRETLRVFFCDRLHNLTTVWRHCPRIMDRTEEFAELDETLERLWSWIDCDLEQAYQGICASWGVGELRRNLLLRLHKRALSDDFEKRIGQTESDQGFIEAYRRCEKMSSDIFLECSQSGDCTKEVWDLWFDYIEKMQAENRRLERPRSSFCEEAIRQIEQRRAACEGEGSPRIEKDVDEWLHEKFLRLVGRPMKNGK